MSLVLGSLMAPRAHNNLDTPKPVMPVHSTGDIMLIRRSDREVTGVLNVAVDTRTGKWEVNSERVQEDATSTKLRVKMTGARPRWGSLLGGKEKIAAPHSSCH